MITTPHPPPGLLHDPAYEPLKDYIIQSTGLAYYADKDDDLCYRIGNRLTGSGQSDCGAYLGLLKTPERGEAELDRLIEELTVGETFFFRHAELFDGLRLNVIPDLLERNRASRRLRIWSAGCSIGAEAYSIAILLAQEFSHQIKGWDISILGTDINRTFLNRAAKGAFHAWDFRGVELPRIEACFQQDGDAWNIRPEYRRGVSFQYYNLVRYPFPSLVNNLVAFDLILCRNVLIYFSPEIARRLVGQFRDCLVDGGWMLTGHAETSTELFKTFRTINVPGAVLYQKPESDRSTGTACSPAQSPEAPPRVPAKPRAPVARPAPFEDFRVKRRRGLQQRPLAVQSSRTGPEDKGDEEHLSFQRLADSGDLDSAMAKCEALTASDPMNPTPHFYLGMLAEQLGDHRRAEMSLRRTIYLMPDNALAHYYYGLVEQKQGQRSEALRSYELVLNLLAPRGDDDGVTGSEGMTVTDLRELVRMQKELLRP